MSPPLVGNGCWAHARRKSKDVPGKNVKAKSAFTGFIAFGTHVIITSLRKNTPNIRFLSLTFGMHITYKCLFVMLFSMIQKVNFFLKFY